MLPITTPNSTLAAERMPIDNNAALQIYLGGRGSSGYLPFGHKERLRAAYGDQFENVLTTLSPYLNADHTPNWQTSTYEAEPARYAQLLCETFPELNEISISSLVNRWSYNWK